MGHHQLAYIVDPDYKKYNRPFVLAIVTVVAVVVVIAVVFAIQITDDIRQDINLPIDSIQDAIENDYKVDCVYSTWYETTETLNIAGNATQVVKLRGCYYSSDWFPGYCDDGYIALRQAASDPKCERATDSPAGDLHAGMVLHDNFKVKKEVLSVLGIALGYHSTTIAVVSVVCGA